MDHIEKQLIGAGIPEKTRVFFKKCRYIPKIRWDGNARRVLQAPIADKAATEVRVDLLRRIYAGATRKIHTGMLFNGYHKEDPAVPANNVPQTDGVATNETFSVDVRVNNDIDKCVVNLTKDGDPNTVFALDQDSQIQTADPTVGFYYEKPGEEKVSRLSAILSACKLKNLNNVKTTARVTQHITALLGNAYHAPSSEAPEAATPTAIDVMDEFHVQVPGVDDAMPEGIKLYDIHGNVQYGGEPQVLGWTFKGLFKKIKAAVCKVGTVIKKAAVNAYKFVASKVEQMGGVGSIVGALVTGGTGIPALGKIVGNGLNTVVGMIDPKLAGTTPTKDTPQNLTELKQAATAMIGSAKDMIINNRVTPNHLAYLKGLSSEELMSKHGRTVSSLSELKLYLPHQVDPTGVPFVEAVYEYATENAPEYDGIEGSGDDSAVPATMAMTYQSATLHEYFDIVEDKQTHEETFCICLFFRGNVVADLHVYIPKPSTTSGRTTDWWTRDLEYNAEYNMSVGAFEWPLDEATIAEPAFILTENADIKNTFTMGDFLPRAIHIMTIPIPGAGVGNNIRHFFPGTGNRIHTKLFKGGMKVLRKN